MFPCFVAIFTRGNNFCDFLKDETLPKKGLSLKERICSSKNKFFPLRVDPY